MIYYIAQFNLTGQDQNKKIENLSGGRIKVTVYGAGELNTFSQLSNPFLRGNKNTLSENTLLNIRQKYLGRNGLVAELFKSLGSASKKDKPKYGQLLNQLKLLPLLRFQEFLKLMLVPSLLLLQHYLQPLHQQSLQ